MRVLQLILVSQTYASPLALPAQSTGAERSAPLRVLFVGNSYTYFNELPRLFQILAVSAGETRLPQVHSASMPGAYLRTHWADSASLGAIRRGKWDYVILQTQSSEPLTQPESTLKYARLLNEEVRRVGGQPVLFQHWNRKNEPEHRVPLHGALDRIASQLAIATVPIGTAFEMVRQRAPAVQLYVSDNSHPSPLGSYLAACVVYAFVYRKSPVGLLPYTFETIYHNSPAIWDTAAMPIDGQVARLLQEVAWEAVRVNFKR
jgi:hypothetical protein